MLKNLIIISGVLDGKPSEDSSIVFFLSNFSNVFIVNFSTPSLVLMLSSASEAMSRIILLSFVDGNEVAWSSTSRTARLINENFFLILFFSVSSSESASVVFLSRSYPEI